MLSQEQRRHELAWAQIRQRPAGRVRVLAGTNDLLKSLSPFRVYTAGPGPVLMLSGWQSHDPSQAALRRQLTGASEQAESLSRLALQAPTAHWLLSVETARWLNRRFLTGGVRIVLRPGAALPADTTLRYYAPVRR